MADKALLSRSGSSCVIGKKTVVMHTKVPEETAEEIRLIARSSGMTNSEFICELLMLRAHGEEAIRSLLLNRLAVVSGKAPNGDEQ